MPESTRGPACPWKMDVLLKATTLHISSCDWSVSEDGTDFFDDQAPFQDMTIVEAVTQLTACVRTSCAIFSLSGNSGVHISSKNMDSHNPLR